MIKQRRADFTDFNSITLGVLLLLVFFPISIFFMIFSSSMSNQTKAIVCGVLLFVFMLVPVLFILEMRRENDQHAEYKAKIQLIHETTSSVKRTRTIYNAPTCKEANIYLKPDIPLCKPGQDRYENKEIIEID